MAEGLVKRKQVEQMGSPDHSLIIGKKKNYELKQVPRNVPELNIQGVEQTQPKLPAGGICTLIGGFLVCLSFASDFSYPNLNTYITSYMRKNGHNDNLAYVDFVFLTTTKNIVQGAVMPWLGGLAKKMGPKLAVATGSAIYSAGYLMTFFTIQHHFALVIFSLALHGIAFCFVYPTAIRTAQAWFPPARKGLVASIVVSGYGFGSSLWAPIQTGFVNPDNLKAGSEAANFSEEVVEAQNCTETGRDRYFTEPEVLDRIPFLFILLGSIYAVMGFIAVVLIAEPKEPKGGKLEDDEDQKIEHEKTDRKNLSPMEVLKTTWFYQILIGFFSMSLTNGIMGNYSKTFGLTFINDDHFYSIVAIFQNILNGFSRILWGFSYDRFGFKKCYSMICVVVCITVTTLPLLPSLGITQLWL